MILYLLSRMESKYFAHPYHKIALIFRGWGPVYVLVLLPVIFHTQWRCWSEEEHIKNVVQNLFVSNFALFNKILLMSCLFRNFILESGKPLLFIVIACMSVPVYVIMTHCMDALW